MTDPKPGERQIRDNQSHKKDLGSSPNGVANQFLAQNRGQVVSVASDGVVLMVGVLLSFDAYSLVVQADGHDRLVFKGPGVVISAAS